MRSASVGLALVCVPLVFLHTPTAGAAQIPLCRGLQVVTAISEVDGDYESIKTVQSISPRLVTVRYAAEVPDTSLFAEKGEVKRVTESRRIRVEDLRSSKHYVAVFSDDSDGFFPGTTALGISTALVRELKHKGEASAGITFTTLHKYLRREKEDPSNVYDWMVRAKLQRVALEKVPVLVNDRRVELDAIRVRAHLDESKEPSEFVFLDDETNPLTLRFRIVRSAVANDSGTSKLGWAAKDGTLTVVKINYQCEGEESGGTSSLEKSLQEQRGADVYSIYFSFNSDVIREESEPTLREIAGLMRKHPDWKLSVHGHTDNVASDTYNLDLSRRRAAAVMTALTQKHGVDAARLSYSGHGESSPKERNDTLEGRARNRRVELVRLP